MSKIKTIVLWSVAGILLIGLFGYGILHYIKVNKVVSILTMAINPSISISLNYKNKVIKTKYNETSNNITRCFYYV